MIDFWASWCAPCRAENPENVKIYNAFHNKGFNIVGVSLDDNTVNWQNAVNNDNLKWFHLSNLKGWKDPIAVLYGVEQIPFTVLIDSQGMVVAVDIHGKELEQKLKIILP